MLKLIEDNPEVEEQEDNVNQFNAYLETFWIGKKHESGTYKP